MWLGGEIKTPPLSPKVRIEVGVLLRRLQRGEKISLPHSRPMPSIGPGCHELRIRDRGANWRIIYRLDPDALVIVEVFAKTTRATPDTVIRITKRRLRSYDDEGEEGERR